MSKFKKIAILGVGLLGGSISLGLKQKLGSTITILGLCSTAKRTKEAVDQHIIDKPLSGLKDIPQDVDLIILAAPISINIDLLKKLQNRKILKACIIDIGSTKKSIEDIAIEHKILNFIPTHPMCGKETSGFENADSNLFLTRPWVICKRTGISTNNINKVKELIRLLKAKTVILDSQTHDKYVSLVSHLPLVISSILVRSVEQTSHKSLILASTGFKDVSRHASADPLLKKDIVLNNKENIKIALIRFRNVLDKFLSDLDLEDDTNIISFFNQTKNQRDKWIRKIV